MEVLMKTRKRIRGVITGILVTVAPKRRENAEIVSQTPSSKQKSFEIPAEERWVRRHKYSLDELVSQVTPKNRHDEITMGKAVGREIYWE
jgi:hypothetical protein